MAYLKKLKESQKFILFLIISILISRIIMYVQFGYETHIWGFSDFFNSINLWDSGWYRKIAEGLYVAGTENSDGTANWNFFPMNALLVRAIISVIHVDTYIVASILNTVLLFFALFMAYKYIMLTRNNVNIAVYFSIFMIFGIYTFYYSVFYSESLYLLLLVMAMYFMKKKQYILMGICGAFLSITRSTGVFFVFVVLAFLIEEYIREGEKKSFIDFIVKSICDYELVLGVMLVPLGLFVHMRYLKIHIGDALAFAHSQVAAFGRTYKGFKVISEGLDSFTSTYLLIFIIIGLAVMFTGVFRKKNYYEMILPIITIVMSGGQTILGSPRYILGSFGFLLYISDDMDKLPRHTRIAIFVIAFFAEMILFHVWAVLKDVILV